MTYKVHLLIWCLFDIIKINENLEIADKYADVNISAFESP